MSKVQRVAAAESSCAHTPHWTTQKPNTFLGLQWIHGISKEENEKEYTNKKEDRPQPE